jgi:ribosomal protein S18 acetylase RimI-like enzyme
MSTFRDGDSRGLRRTGDAYERVVIRPATPQDHARIAEIVHDDPGDEAIALLGSVAAARRHGIATMRESLRQSGPISTVVAALGTEDVVGVVQLVPSDQARAQRRSIVSTRMLLREFGLRGAAARARRLALRAHVALAPPPGTLHIAELDVAPELRDNGIGTLLLQWAEQEARRHGIERLSLITTSTNRARGLYERLGFVITDVRADPRYARVTGIPGRVLMEKRVGERPEAAH